MASPQDEVDIILPTRKREVAYGVVPLMRVRPTVSRCLLILAGFVIAVILIAWNLSSLGMTTEIFTVLVLVMATFMVSITLWPVVSDYWKNGISLSRLKSCIPEDETADKQFTRELFEVERASGFIQWRSMARWAWQSLVKVCTASETSIPTTIASNTHRTLLEAIHLEAALLEPEPILTSTPQNKGLMSVVMVLLGLQAWAAWTNGDLLVMIVSLAFIMYIAIQIPAVRDLIPAFRSDYKAPIAGAGFIEDSNKNLWTVDDSLMILSGRKNGITPVFVHIVGPSGWLLLTYANIKDPEFIKLWKRWNHPQPRPELAPSVKR